MLCDEPLQSQIDLGGCVRFEQLYILRGVTAACSVSKGRIKLIWGPCKAERDDRSDRATPVTVSLHARLDHGNVEISRALVEHDVDDNARRLYRPIYLFPKR